ncbi:MAG: condensation domain-containing protein [Acidimicrobiales bacterium]
MPTAAPSGAPTSGPDAGQDHARPGRAPASLSQRSSLLMSAHNPSHEFMSWVYQLNGKLHVEALAQAIDDVVRRHDMLRVRFEHGPTGPEQVVTPFRPGVMGIVRLDDRPKAQGLGAAVKAIETEYRDMTPWEDAPLRATLYLVAPKTNVLGVFVAEALVDGDSGTLVAAEISRAYAHHAGRPAPDLPEPTEASFLRYVLDHPVPAATEEKAERHWQGMMDLPRTCGRWPTETGDRRNAKFFKVPADEWQALVRAEPALVTMGYVVLLSWLELSLARVAGAERFSVTSAVSNRRLPVTRGMIGNFTGPVRLHAEVHAGERLEDVSPRVMAALREAVLHSVVPVPLAEARAMAPGPYVPPSPLVSFFVFTEREGLDLPGVRQRRFRLHMGTADVLRVNITPDEEGGRNVFFASSSAPRELVVELADTFRSYMDEARSRAASPAAPAAPAAPGDGEADAALAG